MVDRRCWHRQPVLQLRGAARCRAPRSGVDPAARAAGAPSHEVPGLARPAGSARAADGGTRGSAQHGRADGRRPPWRRASPPGATNACSGRRQQLHGALAPAEAEVDREHADIRGLDWGSGDDGGCTAADDARPGEGVRRADLPGPAGRRRPAAGGLQPGGCAGTGPAGGGAGRARRRDRADQRSGERKCSGDNVT